MIVYGWGKRTTHDYGAVISLACPNCGNQKPWRFSRVISWFTLFYIPVIPYTWRYYLSCQVCDRGYQLNQRGTKAVRRVLAAARSLQRGDSTSLEYRQDVIASGLLTPAGAVDPALAIPRGGERRPRLLAWGVGGMSGVAAAGAIAPVLPSGFASTDAFGALHAGLPVFIVYVVWAALALVCALAGAVIGELVYRSRRRA